MLRRFILNMADIKMFWRIEGVGGRVGEGHIA